MQSMHNSKWLFIPTVLIGVVIFFLLIKNRAEPDVVFLKESAKSVYVINVPEVDVVPRVKSNGTVKPDQVWRSVAEVGGKIIEMHPRLKKGAVIGKDQILLKIDSTDYELAIAQAKASIAASKAQLTELDVQKKNTESLLNIERNTLELSKSEVNRKEQMFQDKTISRADYDKEKKNYLNQQKNYVSLNNTLALYPVQRERIIAELKKLEVQFTTAQLNLQRTIIKMPFTGRISEMNIERRQFVRQGEVLVVADGMEKAEVTVQIPIDRMSYLLRTGKAVSIEALQLSPTEKLLGLTARVELQLGDHIVAWKGNVTRISETLDLKTRTIGVIIEVDDPYKGIRLGIKPPLMKGMFVSVELLGRPKPASLVVPRSAIYDSRLHVVTDDNRLTSKKITTGLVMNGFAIVTAGVEKNDQVIVSDLVPAIQGMLLKPVNDEKTLAMLIAAATAGVAH